MSWATTPRCSKTRVLIAFEAAIGGKPPPTGKRIPNVGGGLPSMRPLLTTLQRGRIYVPRIRLHHCGCRLRR
ncbi:hypothetical protein PspCFBP13506_10305 [Pseudomonas sp. CFBP13506]|uniref:Uncharacterized protein n=1 Tax=Pseudomonas fluorescens TaxID=294 RepID=A0A4Y9THJ5_PSEFL|nr:hypothetical protein E4T65_16045 [Pseudomonas fluorescens]TKJ62774.1 hypothetical protein PspCFBP13506_10305 [Pseudomonas sp. CFBP13506]